MTTATTRPTCRAADVVVIGAPGATWADGNLTVSAAARERAELAAHYWLSSEQLEHPMRVICVAGRPGMRSGMRPLPAGKSESAEMIRIMLGLGVPDEVIRPNQQFQLNRELSDSTVDEVGILVEAGLISPEMYKQDEPLAIVAHRRHGARVIDILQKVGFKESNVLLLSPETQDARSEIALRLLYRMLVLGTRRRVEPEVLRQRELRLMVLLCQIRRLLGIRTRLMR